MTRLYVLHIIKCQTENEMKTYKKKELHLTYNSIFINKTKNILEREEYRDRERKCAKRMCVSDDRLWKKTSTHQKYVMAGF